jgi:hypothetical protein
MLDKTRASLLTVTDNYRDWGGGNFRQRSEWNFVCPVPDLTAQFGLMAGC